MLLVVADTGPIRYLVEIGHIGILPRLFERIFIPSTVYDELRHPSAPAPVRAWVNALPAWLEVLAVTAIDDPAFRALDDGEKSALTLGMALGAGLILIDERKGAAVALQKGFQVTGTLGLLTRSAQRGLLDLADALERLKRTNFHYRRELFDDVLKKYGESRKG
jgi:predicted nucleic acid-binding protein